MKTIEQRIEALERSNRRQRYTSIALALVMLAGGQDLTQPWSTG